MLILGLAANELICYSIKLLFHRKRPNKQRYSNLIEKMDAGSFPSVHSSRAAFAYSTLILNSELFMGAVFFFMILTVGYSRVFLKKHYISDVVAGYFIGFILFILLILKFDFILSILTGLL